MEKNKRVSQSVALLTLLEPNLWRNLWQLSDLTGFYTGSIASRLRDLRCKGYNIVKRSTDKTGVFEYCLIKPEYVQTELFENTLK